MDALADHAALELSEGAGNLEYQRAHRRGGVDVLLIEVEIDATLPGAESCRAGRSGFVLRGQ